MKNYIESNNFTLVSSGYSILIFEKKYEKPDICIMYRINWNVINTNTNDIKYLFVFPYSCLTENIEYSEENIDSISANLIDINICLNYNNSASLLTITSDIPDFDTKYIEIYLSEENNNLYKKVDLVNNVDIIII
jgi:hypothetical protein